MIDFLTQEQVLEQQIKLLNTAGPSLASFHTHDPDQPIFFSPPESTCQSLELNHRLANTKTTPAHPNTSFYFIGLILLNAIVQQKSTHHLLQKFKLSLYDRNLNLSTINDFTHRQLSSDCMKKIIVQFLQILPYFKGNLQDLFSKYPIVLEILSVFFRVILVGQNLQDAQFYNKVLNHFQSITSLLDFFDISYMIRKNIISIQNTTFCIFIDVKTNKAYIGERINDLSTKTSDLNLNLRLEDQEQPQIQVQTEVEEVKKFSPKLLTPTPCFGLATWDDPNLKGQNSGSKNKALGKVIEETDENASKKKLGNPQQIIKSIYEAKQNENFRNNIQSFSKQCNIQQRQEQLKQLQSHRTSKQANDSTNQRSSNGMDKMKLSQFHFGPTDEDMEKKSAKSQKLGRRNRKQTEQNDEDHDGHLSHFQTQRGRSYRLQSHVVQLKIEPIMQQRRYKTNVIDQIKSTRPDFKNPKKVGSKAATNKTFGKIPYFLTQKNETSKRTSPMHIHMKTQQDKVKKPKVTFTYGITQRNTVHTTPPAQLSSRLKYHPQPSYLKPNIGTLNNIATISEWKPIMNSPPGFPPAYTRNYYGN